MDLSLGVDVCDIYASDFWIHILGGFLLEVFFLFSCAPSLGLVSVQYSFFRLSLISDLVPLGQPGLQHHGEPRKREWQQGSPRRQAFSSGGIGSPFVLILRWAEFCARSILVISWVHDCGWISVRDVFCCFLWVHLLGVDV